MIVVVSTCLSSLSGDEESEGTRRKPPSTMLVLDCGTAEAVRGDLERDEEHDEQGDWGGGSCFECDEEQDDQGRFVEGHFS